MTVLRVMTFNIRGAPPEDGVNVWENRMDLNLQVIKNNAPDLIGFQEAQTENLDVFHNDLKEYVCDSGKKANRPDRILFNAIFWKPEVLSCVASGSFYLSQTPEVWSKDWDSARVRLAHWVKFRRMDSGFEFLHLNTHLDHISHQARVEGSKLILQQLAQLFPDPLPVLLTGDFNSPPEPILDGTGPTPYRIFQDGGLIDTYSVAPSANGGRKNTFHGFEGEKFISEGDGATWRIDWIMVLDRARSLQVKSCQTIRTAAPPIYPSDHYPVIADLEMAD